MAGKSKSPASVLDLAVFRSLNEWNSSDIKAYIKNLKTYGLARVNNSTGYYVVDNLASLSKIEDENVILGEDLGELLDKISPKPNPHPKNVTTLKVEFDKRDSKLLFYPIKEPILLTPKSGDFTKKDFENIMSSFTTLKLDWHHSKRGIATVFKTQPDFQGRIALTKNILLDCRGAGRLLSGETALKNFKKANVKKIECTKLCGIAFEAVYDFLYENTRRLELGEGNWVIKFPLNFSDSKSNSFNKEQLKLWQILFKNRLFRKVNSERINAIVNKLSGFLAKVDYSKIKDKKDKRTFKTLKALCSIAQNGK